MIRNKELGELVAALESENSRKYDRVVPANCLSYRNGQLVIANATTQETQQLVAQLENVGVTMDMATDGPDEVLLKPLPAFDDQIAEKLGIPLKYMRRMRLDCDEPAEFPGDQLIDRNVNHWLEKADANYLIRGFRDDDGGVARAFLSDKFKIVDNLDVLVAGLDGIKQSGRTVQIDQCDLTDSRMYIKLWCPEVSSTLSEVLKGRGKQSNRHEFFNVPADKMFAGLVIGNSETGNGTYFVKPRLVISGCWNGMIREKEAVKRVHLGSKLDLGEIKWSEETQKKAMELVMLQMKDAVQTFLNPSFLQAVADELEEKGAKRLEHPIAAIDNVCRTFSYSDEQKKGVLDSFMEGGAPTVFGLSQAVTWAAKEVASGDDQFEMEVAGSVVIDRIAEFDRPVARN